MQPKGDQPAQSTQSSLISVRNPHGISQQKGKQKLHRIDAARVI
jgi:hypothetical protein